MMMNNPKALEVEIDKQMAAIKAGSRADAFFAKGIIIGFIIGCVTVSVIVQLLP